MLDSNSLQYSVEQDGACLDLSDSSQRCLQRYMIDGVCENGQGHELQTHDSGIDYTPSHWRVFHGHPSLWFSTSCARCFSTSAFASSNNCQYGPTSQSTLHTGFTSHAISAGDDP